MLQRVFAAWLVALTFSPFTAPFALFDLTTSRQATAISAEQSRHAPTLAHSAVSQPVPIVRAVGRLRVRLTSAAALSKASPVRPCDASTALTSLLNALGPGQHHAGSPVLRI
jgi:hypothetical protein